MAEMENAADVEAGKNKEVVTSSGSENNSSSLQELEGLKQQKTIFMAVIGVLGLLSAGLGIALMLGLACPEAETKTVTNTEVKEVCAKDAYDEIVERGYVNIGYPHYWDNESKLNRPMVWTGFVNLDGMTDKKVENGDYSGVKPTGYFGGIMRACVIAIFGKYSNDLMKFPPTNGGTRWDQSYNGLIDLGFQFASDTAERRTNYEFKEYSKGKTCKNADGEDDYCKANMAAPFSEPYMSVRTVWAVNDAYTPDDCSGGKCDTMKKHLAQMMLKKKKVDPTATYFLLGSCAGNSHEPIAKFISDAWGNELKASTGLDLYSFSMSPCAKTKEVGNKGDLTIPQLGVEVKDHVMDSIASDDWEVLRYDQLLHLQATEKDLADNNFELSLSVPYGVILPFNKRTSKLNNAVTLALTCLKRAEYFGLHSKSDFQNASPSLKLLFSQSFGKEFANDQEVCRLIIEEVGSLKTLRQEVVDGESIRNYIVDTTAVPSIDL